MAAKFNPVKEDKEGVVARRQIWSTEAVEAALDGLRKGKKLVANPFYDNNTKLLKADLNFERTEEEEVMVMQYMTDIIKTTVDSITTDHIQTLCIGKHEADMLRGKRVLIVDDVISTGESLKSIETLVNQVGADIVGRMAVLAEGGAADRDDIIYLEKLPVFNPDGSVK